MMMMVLMMLMLMIDDDDDDDDDTIICPGAGRYGSGYVDDVDGGGGRGYCSAGWDVYD